MVRAEKEEVALAAAQAYAPSDIAPATHIPKPPFWGTRVLETRDFNLREIFGLINRRVLFRGQWQYRRGRRSEDEYRHFISETPKFYRWSAHRAPLSAPARHLRLLPLLLARERAGGAAATGACRRI